jgi:hypothetical protein
VHVAGTHIQVAKRRQTSFGFDSPLVSSLRSSSSSSSCPLLLPAIRFHSHISRSHGVKVAVSFSSQHNVKFEFDRPSMADDSLCIHLGSCNWHTHSLQVIRVKNGTAESSTVAVLQPVIHPALSPASPTNTKQTSRASQHDIRISS